VAKTRAPEARNSEKETPGKINPVHQDAFTSDSRTITYELIGSAGLPGGRRTATPQGLALKNMYDALSFTDLEGRILDVNERAVEKFGMSKKELKKMRIFDLISGAGPEFMELIREGTIGGGFVRVEATCTAMGRWSDTEIVASRPAADVPLGKRLTDETDILCFLLRGLGQRKTSGESDAGQEMFGAPEQMKALIRQLNDNLQVLMCVPELEENQDYTDALQEMTSVVTTLTDFAGGKTPEDERGQDSSQIESRAPEERENESVPLEGKTAEPPEYSHQSREEVKKKVNRPIDDGVPREDTPGEQTSVALEKDEVQASQLRNREPRQAWTPSRVSKKGKAPAILVLTGILLLTVIGALLTARATRDARRGRELALAESIRRKSERLTADLNDADSYALGNPGDFDEIIKRYGEIEKEGGNAEQAVAARDRRMAVQKDLDLAIAVEKQRLLDKANALLAGEGFEMAPEVFASCDSRFRKSLAPFLLAQEKRVRADVVRRSNEEKAKAKTAKARAKKAKMEAEAAMAEAEGILTKTLSLIAEDLCAGERGRAIGRLQRLSDERHAERISSIESDVCALAEREEAIRDYFGLHVGKELSVNLKAGSRTLKIVRTTGTTVETEQTLKKGRAAYMKRVVFQFDDLEREELVRICVSSHGMEQQLLHGALAAEQGEYVSAMKHLTASKRPLAALLLPIVESKHVEEKERREGAAAQAKQKRKTAAAAAKLISRQSKKAAVAETAIKVTPFAEGGGTTLEEGLAKVKRGGTIVLAPGVYPPGSRRRRGNPAYEVKTPDVTILGNRAEIQCNLWIRAGGVTLKGIKCVMLEIGENVDRQISVVGCRFATTSGGDNSVARFENCVGRTSVATATRAQYEHCTIPIAEGEDRIVFRDESQSSFNNCVIVAPNGMFRMRNGDFKISFNRSIVSANPKVGFVNMQDEPVDDKDWKRDVVFRLVLFDKPVFVDPDRGDYRLADGSPGKGKAIDGSDYGALLDEEGWPILE